MDRLVCEFDAQPNRVAVLEGISATHGRWAEFFKQSADYVGTELYKNTSDPNRFVAVDVWRSRVAYEAFRKANAVEYSALDEWCRQLLTHERMLGSTDDGKA